MLCFGKSSLGVGPKLADIRWHSILAESLEGHVPESIQLSILSSAIMRQAKGEIKFGTRRL